MKINGLRWRMLFRLGVVCGLIALVGAFGRSRADDERGIVPTQAGTVATISVGNRFGTLLSIVANPETRRLYGLSTSGQIGVFDLDTARLISKIRLPRQFSPRRIAVDPKSNRLVVSGTVTPNLTTPTDVVLAVDGMTERVTSVTPVPVNTTALAVNPLNGRAYVANTNGTVAVVRLDLGTIETSIPVENNPTAIAVDGTTGKVFVLNSNSDSISVIDSESNVVTAVVRLPVGFPGNLVLGPSRGYVNSPNGTASFDPRTNEVRTEPQLTERRLSVVAADGERLFCRDAETRLVLLSPDGRETARFPEATLTGSGAIALDPRTGRFSVVSTAPPENISTVRIFSDGAVSSVIPLPDATPSAIVVDPSRNRAFVTNENSNTVAVIDTATNTVVGTVPVGRLPDRIVVNERTGRVYVTTRGARTLTAIDGESATVMRTVQLSFSPSSVATAVAVNPATNLVYVANPSNGNVTVLDGDTLESARTLEIDGRNALAVNAGRLYALGDREFVSVNLETGDRTVFATFQQPGLVRDFAVNPTTNRIYLPTGGGRISILDGATGSETSAFTIPGTIGSIAVNPLSGRVFVVNFTPRPQVSVLDASNTVIASVPLTTDPGGIAVNPTNGRLFVTNRTADTVSVFDETLGPATLQTVAPTVASDAAPRTLARGGRTILSIVVSNPNTIPLTGMSLSFPLPEGVTVAAPEAVETIGFRPSVAVASDGRRIDLADGALDPLKSATIRITLTATSPGFKPIVSDPLRTNETEPGDGVVVALNVPATLSAIIPTGPAGLNPTSIAVNSKRNLVYVANQGSGTISVIDSETDSLVTTIPVAAGKLIYQSKLDRLYALSSAGIFVIDGETNSIVGVLRVVLPSDFAVNSMTSRVFVISSFFPEFTVFDGESFAQLATGEFIALPSRPVAILTDSQRDRFFLCSSGGLTEYDGTTYQRTEEYRFTLSLVMNATNPRQVLFSENTRRFYAVTSIGGMPGVQIVGYDLNRRDIFVNTRIDPNSGVFQPSVAVDTERDLVYVGSRNRSLVTVVDGVSGTVAAQIPTAAVPHAMIHDPATDRLWVALGDNSAVVIPGGMTRPKGTVSLGYGPSILGVNPTTNRAYVGSTTDGLQVLDSSTNRPTRIPVAQVASLAVDPLGNRIFVGTFFDGIRVVDGRSNQITGTIPVPPNTAPLELAIDPGANRLYARFTAVREIVEIDTRTNTTVRRLSFNAVPELMAINPTTKRLYVQARTEGSFPVPILIVVDIDSGQVIQTIELPTYPVRMVVDPTTERIHLVGAARNFSVLATIDGKTNTVVRQLPLPTNVVSVEVNPRTGRIYALTNQGLWVFDDSLDRAVAVFPVGFSPRSVAVNPTTGRVFVANQGSDDIYVFEDLPPRATIAR